jgi:DNA-binding transcriptional ArsR family regulator
MLDYLIASKTRLKILRLFYQDPASQHYLREIVRIIGEEVNAVKRELDILDKARVLSKERRLNKVFYTLNPKYLLYEDFTRIFAKDNDLARQLIKMAGKLGKLKYLVMSIKYAKKQVIREDEVYVLFVGTVVVPEVEALLASFEQPFGMPINFTVMNEQELIFRKRNNDPFLWQFLRTPKIMLVGLEEDLMK